MILVALLCAVGAHAAGLATYHDRALGFSITYPSSLYLTHDADLLRRVMRAGLRDLPASEEVRDAARNAGTRLVISLYPFAPERSGRLNPNLELSAISVAGADLDSAGYAEQVASQLPDAVPHARILEDPEPVRIDGRTFYRLTVGVTLHGVDLRNQQFVYVSRRQELAYALAITDTKAGFAAHRPIFEAVVKSLQFDSPTAQDPRMVLPQSMR